MDESLDKSRPRIYLREASRTPNGRARATTLENSKILEAMNSPDPYMELPDNTRLETIHERNMKDEARKGHRDSIKAGAKKGKENLMAEVTPERRATNQHYKDKDGPDRRSYEDDVGKESMFKSEEESENGPLLKSAQTPIVRLIEERRRLR